jgi:hypothetical protein
MRRRDARDRSLWWALSGACAALAAALLGRAQLDPWLFGALLMIAWGLLAYGLGFLWVPRSLRLLLTATALALVVVVWNHTTPQPRIGLDAVRLRRLPSTARPGVVELVLKNSGGVAADIVVFPVAYLAPLFRNARELAAAHMEAELSERLKRADRVPPTGAIVVPAGQTARVDVDIPPSERAWYFQRGEVTVLVTARLHYRDRVFLREKVSCHFANPQSGQWLACPFLND